MPGAGTSKRTDTTLIPTYLKEMARWELLSREEEVEIGEDLVRTRRTLSRSLERELGRDRRPCDGWTDARLIQAYRGIDDDRDTEASADARRLGRRLERLRSKLIRHNLRLVVYLAKRNARGEISLMDLIQEGNMGLIKAVERFDTKKKCKFSTYAYWWIKQAMDRATVNQGPLIRIPVQLESKIRRVRSTMNDNSQEGVDREETRRETARQLEMPIAEVERLLQIPHEASRAPVLETDAGTLDPLERLEAGSDESPQERVLERERVSEVRSLLEDLTGRERSIVRRRFGIGAGGRTQTLNEIGSAIGLSRERVRQLLERASEKIAASEDAQKLRPQRLAAASTSCHR